MAQAAQIFALVIIFCLLTSFLTNPQSSSHDSEPYRTVGDPRLQFLLASQKLGTIDVYVNDYLVATSIAFGQVTGYIPIKYDRYYRLQIQTNGVKSFVKELHLDRYRAYSIIIRGANDYMLLDDSSWHFATRHKRAPVLRLIDLTERTHAFEVELRNENGCRWFTYFWHARHWTDWLEVKQEGPQQIELHYNNSAVLNVTVWLERSAGYNFFLLEGTDEKKLLGFVRPAFLAAPFQSVTEYTFCIAIILLIWCNALHRLYMSFWSWLYRTSFKPVHARTLPSIREVNNFLYSVTMTLGSGLFIVASYHFLHPVGLLGVWEGVVQTELTTRMDYYQNYFKALGVMIVALYSYELATDQRMPVSTIIHHGGAITGTVFLINFTDEMAEFWFGWISLAYVQFELPLFWGLYLRDYNGRTGRAKQLSERVLIAGWLMYMSGIILEVTFYVKALISLNNRVTKAFLWMSTLVMSVWLIEQLMCLCCTARSIKRKDLLRNYPAFEMLCWFSWWVSRYPASLAKFNLQLLHESWDEIPKVHDIVTRCTVTVHNLPFTVWIPSALQKDAHAKLHKIRLQAAEQLDLVANTLLPEDLSAEHFEADKEHYSVNHQMVHYGT